MINIGNKVFLQIILMKDMTYLFGKREPQTHNFLHFHVIIYKKIIETYRSLPTELEFYINKLNH